MDELDEVEIAQILFDDAECRAYESEMINGA